MLEEEQSFELLRPIVLCISTMATTLPVVLPGDHISPASLPTPVKKNKALTLGPGLQHIPPDTIRATIAGALVTDAKKNAAWIEHNSGRVSLFMHIFTCHFLTPTPHHIHKLKLEALPLSSNSI